MDNRDMVEIRWHGRGGQGAKTACLLLADAAFSSGKYVQGFPEYGPERSGAPITAYNRISAQRCTIHSNIYQPDYVVVVDEGLLSCVDVTAGLKETGAILINSSRSPEENCRSQRRILPSFSIKISLAPFTIISVISGSSKSSCSTSNLRTEVKIFLTSSIFSRG